VVAAGGDPAATVKAPGKKQRGEKKFTVGDTLRELGMPVLNSAPPPAPVVAGSEEALRIMAEAEADPFRAKMLTLELSPHYGRIFVDDDVLRR